MNHKQNSNKIERFPKVALVLSGGGARGLAHLGVLSVLEEYKIPIDFIVAASFGSIVAGYHAYGYSIPEMIERAKSFKLCSLLSLKKPWYGIFSGEKGEEFLKKDLGDIKIEDLRIPLIITVSDISRGKIITLEEGLLRKALRASSSFPALFHPFIHNNHVYVDGGILNRYLISIARDKGAELIIYSDVSIIIYIRLIKLVYKIFTLIKKHRIKKGKILKQKLKRLSPLSVYIGTLSLYDEYKKHNRTLEDTNNVIPIVPVTNEIRPFQFNKVDEGFELGRKETLKTIDRIVDLIYGK